MNKKNLVCSFLLLFTLLLSMKDAFADDLPLTGELSGTYYSDANIYTQDTCTVEVGASATLHATNTITLNPGFHAKLGSTFEASIDDDPLIVEEGESIQAAITFASPGDTIYIADGTHYFSGYPDISFQGKAITVKSINGPENCIIDLNGTEGGFRFELSEGSDSVLSGVTISNAVSDGIYILDASPTISQCIIRGSNGAGIRVQGQYGDPSPVITNCLIVENGNPGIVTNNAGLTTLMNCTIANNTSQEVFVLGGTGPTLKNSIVWASGEGLYTHVSLYDTTGTITATYCNIDDVDIQYDGVVYPGEGNINADPLFINLVPEGGDYHLDSNSPCIDLGTAEGAPTNDIDGDPRPDGGYDMGCDEAGNAGLTKIQPLIDAASNGDTIIIPAGTYRGPGNQNLDFQGKAITLVSASGPESCIIDLDGTGNGFYFHTGEGQNSVVSGFTILNAGNDGIIIENTSSPIIINCIIKGSAQNGIYIEGNNSSPNITNCLVVENGASGIYVDSFLTPRIMNCTIAYNGTYGISFINNYFTTVTNTIIYGNVSSSILGTINQNYILYCDIEGWSIDPTHHIINSDPLFVNPYPYGEDYHIQSSSPCIGAATNSGAPEDDIDGEPRPNDWWDIGCDEFWNIFTLTVLRGAGDPLVGIEYDIFDESGSYLGLSGTTDENGQISHPLPDGTFRFRLNYMGHVFWTPVYDLPATYSEEFTIPHGTAEVHVLQGVSDLAGANVYLFSESGAYLDWAEITDSNGIAEFLVPAATFKFRADYGGNQVWSDPVGIVADQVTSLELYLTSVPPTVSISADSTTIQTGETPTLTWTSTNATTASIDQGIGNVTVNGSYQLIPGPTVTTTYTITVQGSGVPATDSVTIVVGEAPQNVDYGISGSNGDEQEGGGGLLAQSIRILNGNLLETRDDLSFSSPNSLGLSLSAAYNSQSDELGALGYGWTHTYEATLNPSFSLGGATYLKILDNTGSALYFFEQQEGEYAGVFGEESEVRAESGEYVWYLLDGTRYGFSSAGRLDWMEDEKGNRLELAYDTQGRLESVTDSITGRVIFFHYDANDLLDYVSGPMTPAISDGIWVDFGYDGNQNLTSVTYADGSGFDYTYADSNDIHNLTKKEDKAGHDLNTWGYDASDRVTSSFTIDGQGMTINYVSDTQVEVTDAYGTLRFYTLSETDGRRKVTAMTGLPNAPYSDTNAVGLDYDEAFRLIEVEYAGGTINQYQDYDGHGNPETLILAVGSTEERVITYTYHPDMSAPLTRTEPSLLGSGNKETIWDYDNPNDPGDTPGIYNENPTKLLYRIIEKGFTKNAFGYVIEYTYTTQLTYNSDGQVLFIDGPRPGTGDTTSFTYDPITGDLLTITRPEVGSLGNTVLSLYDAAGQVGLVTDENGKSRHFEYDGRGRVTDIDYLADSSTSSIVYNIAGLPDSTIDEDGVTRAFQYFPDYGRLYRTTDVENNYIEYTYDAQGNRTEMSKYDASATRTSWKGWDYQGSNIPGMLWKEIDVNEAFTEYAYDLNTGNVSSVTDGELNETLYYYDVMNRLKEVEQPGSAITSYTYDGHGNLETMTDAEGQMTTYEYDDMGRVVYTNSPDSGTVTYAYDEASNPVSKTDANNITVDYTYDNLNRLIDVNFPIYNGLPAYSITYTYDNTTQNGIGRRTGMTDPSGATTFDYDSRGRLTQKTATINGQAYTFDQVYSPGNRILDVAYPSDRTLAYTRDTMGRMQDLDTTYNSVTTPLVSGMTYNPFAGPNGMTNGAGGVVYNQSGECNCLQVANPGEQMEKIYEYDNNRNLVSFTYPNLSGYDQTFTYDALNRLETAQGWYGDISYTYDNVGNRLTRVINTYTDDYAYATGTNKMDEVTGLNPNTFSYDANGSVIEMGTKTLTYNQNNRLIKVEEGLTTLGEYTYNGLGQRVMKTVNGETTLFHYDLNGNLIAEGLLDGTITKEYLYMGKIRTAMVDVATQSIYYYLNDRLGTPQFMTDSSGAMVWQAFYKPFGEATINPDSTVVNNIRFPGQYYDEETGLHYNYHRYYDLGTGRYLTPDPIGQLGGINVFSYTENNPINLSDSHGLWAGIDDVFTGPIDEIIVIGGLAIAAAFGSKWAENVIDDLKDLISDDVDDCEAEVVYRVFGGVHAKLYGRSWTPIDPRTVKNYRDVAGLPTRSEIRNTGRYIVQGILTDDTGVIRKMADPLDENIGGLPEYLVPDPKKQIQIISVKRLTPQL